MSVFPRFVFPWALLLLVIVPWAIWVGVNLRSLSPARKWLAVVLRTVILLCLVGALAGSEIVKVNDRLAVFFLLDHSNSVREEVRLAALQAIRETCQTYMTGKDETGVIVFGEEASIELSVGPTFELEKVNSYVGGEQTDLASAVRLAVAAFPQGYMRRIVILSDGNETQGNALEEVKLAQASGVEVDSVPLDIGAASEVRLREVAMPNRVNTDEPFRLQAVVHADQDCEGTLRLYRRAKGGAQLLQSAKVMLQKGDNAFVLPQELGASGFYEYEATIESGADTVMANNESRAFTVIYGEPTVLYVEGDPEHGTYLEPALRAEGLEVVKIDPSQIPVNLAQFQDFSAVILSDVSSTDLSPDQLKLMEALVHDLGIGLVMVGGPKSFGAGGYLDTPVEKALPVNMDIKQRKIMPRGALVLCMHTCEFADGNAWAREISLAALNVLSPQDLMGATAYLYGEQGSGDGWLFPLQPVADKHLMRMALNTSQIGDMPSVQPGLKAAYQALKSADAAVKRVIMISDGDPAAPTIGLLNSMKKEKIAVSTVCINPHKDSDQEMLRWVAERTGGQYYYVTNPNRLPQIFTKEAAVVKRGLLIEKPFTPKVLHDSELLRGLLDAGLPQLRGYVTTTPKENATIPLVSNEGDPILAHWRYGLGKSVAFTSDATSRWAPDWLQWQGFNRFWAQTVRWALREVSPTNFRVETKVRDGKGYVRIDAVDDQGKFVNFLRPRGIVVGPPKSSAPSSSLERSELNLMQTGPGIYEGVFPVSDRGIYMLNITYSHPDGSQGTIPAGLALGYSREYEYNTTNRALLDQLALVGNGRVMSPGDSPFEHTLQAAATVTSIWQFLVTLAVCLFPIEIFVRRVVFDLLAMYAWCAARLRKIPALGRLVPMPALRPVVVTGAYGSASQPSRQFVYTAAPGAGGLDPAGLGDRTAVDPSQGAESPPASATLPEAPKAPGRTEYTSQLLAAKERAMKKRLRKDGDKNESTRD